MELTPPNSTDLPPSNSLIVYSRRRPVKPTPTPPASRVPAGWGVEEVPRSCGTHIDRYYYEPGTGKKFRSIREVEAYLNGGKLGYRRKSTPRKSPYNIRKQSYKHRRLSDPGVKKMRLDDGEMSQSHLAMVPYKKSYRTPSFTLPDDWLVEEVPRKHFKSWVDKYYYEPGTGRKFRSLAAVERHLEELEENTPLSKALEEIKENIPLSKVFKRESLTKSSKKKAPEENTQSSSFVDPPTEVKWVLGSPQGDEWSPYVSEELVADDVKKLWTNNFMHFMNQGINNSPDGGKSCD